MNFLWVFFLREKSDNLDQRQRWKNIEACKQCVCKFFSSLGKICAKSLLFFLCKSELCCDFALLGGILMALNLVNFYFYLTNSRNKSN